MRDIAENERVRARGTLQSVATRDGKEITVVGVVPRLSLNPGRISSLGPRLGEHTDDILSGMSYSSDQIARLRSAGVI